MGASAAAMVALMIANAIKASGTLIKIEILFALSLWERVRVRA